LAVEAVEEAVPAAVAASAAAAAATKAAATARAATSVAERRLGEALAALTTCAPPSPTMPSPTRPASCAAQVYAAGTGRDDGLFFLSKDPGFGAEYFLSDDIEEGPCGAPTRGRSTPPGGPSTASDND